MPAVTTPQVKNTFSLKRGKRGFNLCHSPAEPNPFLLRAFSHIPQKNLYYHIRYSSLFPSKPSSAGLIMAQRFRHINTLLRNSQKLCPSGTFLKRDFSGRFCFSGASLIHYKKLMTKAQVGAGGLPHRLPIQKSGGAAPRGGRCAELLTGGTRPACTILCAAPAARHRQRTPCPRRYSQISKQKRGISHDQDRALHSLR